MCILFRSGCDSGRFFPPSLLLFFFFFAFEFQFSIKGKEESKTKGRDEPDDEDECKDNSTDEGEPTELGGSESERKTDLGKSGGGNTKAVGGIGNRTDTVPLAESKVSSIFGTSELVRAAHDRK